MNDLQRDPALRQPTGEHAGKLACPYAFGVVLTGIDRAQFESHDLDRVLPAHRVICKDEMRPTSDMEAFQSRLWTMFTYRFREIRIEVPVLDTPTSVYSGGMSDGGYRGPGAPAVRLLDGHRAEAGLLKSAAKKSKLSGADERIKLMSIHGSKGLEFSFVAIAGVGRLPRARADVASEAKLLYVAMTRATERLMVTAHERTAFVERLVA